MGPYRLYIPVLLMLLLVSACGGGSGDGSVPDASGTARSAGVVGYAGVLDPAQLPVLKQGTTAHQVSSYDRSGGNIDFGDGPMGYSVLYEEGGRFFILDEAGPGIVTRFWLTYFEASAAGEDPTLLVGDVRVEVDGRSEGDVLLRDYFSGSEPEAPFPLAAGPERNSGAYYSYRQIAFRERIRISVSDPLNYYHLGFHRLAPDVFDQWLDSYGDIGAADAREALLAGRRAVAFDRQSTEGELEPGESATVFDLPGPARVTALEIDFEELDAALARDVWISITWDGAAEPQVEAPIAFLFGVPEGGAHDSYPAWASGKGSYGLYLPMPYEESAKIRFENRSTLATVPASRWRLETEPMSADAPAWGYLSARLRISFVGSEDPRDVLVLDARGTGHLVGTVMNKGCDGECLFIGFGLGHFEGDERIFVDESPSPSFHGTGAEDYFNAGLYYLGAPFQLPTHGLTRLVLDPDARGVVNRAAVYRWHVLDPIPFNRRLRFTIEHGPLNDMPVRFESLPFVYLRPEATWRGPVDTIDLSSAADRQQHGYSDAAEVAEVDSSFPGSLPGRRSTNLVRYNLDPIRFRLSVNGASRGIRLRRLLDAAQSGQEALVYVDGTLAGTWLDSDANTFERWRESAFEIEPALTTAKVSIEIRLEPVSEAPFSAARYEAFAY